jgi:5-(carboxyamino)imidazole ribonucleotide synthase
LTPLSPGSTIGILGGGQLGRMLAIAAAQLGLRCHVYCPDASSPAFEVAAKYTVAPYENTAALDAFAKDCDVVTCEFENVPAATLARVSTQCVVRPSAHSFAICQDRRAEKELAVKLGIDSAAWRDVPTLAELDTALGELAVPSILKSRHLGYDGKGQARLDSMSSTSRAWAAIGNAPSILEALVPFAREVSVIAVRDAGGNFAAYDVTENIHKGGILHTSRVPASIAAETAQSAVDIALRIGNALGHVGVFAVEMFVIEEGGAERLLVNEIAPRVHNTGHWTIEGCVASQFEAHIRAVAGWPLPDTARIADAEMTNLIGADAEAWAAIAAEPGAALHLYGKTEARSGRKMGHVTRLRMYSKPV